MKNINTKLNPMKSLIFHSFCLTSREISRGSILIPYRRGPLLLVHFRAVQDHQEPLEIQAHRDFRVCQEREELQELQARRVTE